VHISQVIGWKFNNQPGMQTRGDVIIKFPGGIPSQADQDTWTAEYLVQFPEGFDDWKETIQATDDGMPRYLEDLITENNLSMPAFLQQKYLAKIKIRGERP